MGTKKPARPATKKSAEARRPHRVTSRRSTAGTTSTTRAPSPWAAAARVGFVAEHLGSRELARLLRVSSSQPTRWRRGEETPGPGSARAIADLDYVLARLLQVWERTVALDWLTTANSFLGGARPLDVVLLRGAGEVVDAIDAEVAGAFA
jgi:uncharacterized protein (DUF2384 family)